MHFTDKLTVDGLRHTSDGFLVGTAKVARTGIQTYNGAELGRPEMKEVRVYRPEAEVFSEDSLKSYAYRPLVIEHPDKPVTADNWKSLAVGQTGGEVIRDGAFIRVPMVVMDAAAIRTVEGGKRELSMGYQAELVWQDGLTPEGESYDALQTNLRMNHLAIVSRARGGPQLKLGDTGAPDMSDKTTQIVRDGLPVNVPETAAPIVSKWLADADKAIADADARAKTAQAAADAATKEAEAGKGKIAALEKQLADAAMTPAKLADAVKARSGVMSKAKAILGDTATLDAKTDDEIRLAVVSKVLGDDVAKTMSADAVAGAFAMVKDAATTTGDPVRHAVRDGLTSADPWNPKVFADAGVPMKKGA